MCVFGGYLGLGGRGRVLWLDPDARTQTHEALLAADQQGPQNPETIAILIIIVIILIMYKNNNNNNNDTIQ